MTHISGLTFPALPVLDGMVRLVGKAAGRPMERVVFICVQHLLETTGSLFEALLQLGVYPEHIYVLGKPYSTNEGVSDRLRSLGIHVGHNTDISELANFRLTFEQDIRTLWNIVSHEIRGHGIRGIVVLDDGGHCLSTIPSTLSESYPMIGIEQTTSGLHQISSQNSLPIIQVASCAAKRHIEPPIITKAILAKLGSLIPTANNSGKIGVIGLGHIGQMMARDIVGLGHKVLVCDRNMSLAHSIPGANWCNDVRDVLSDAQFIFGCAGEDIVEDVEWIESLDGAKTLISCSSEDREFQSLLRFLNKERQGTNNDPLASVSYPLRRGVLTILRGGFPINFDGSPESVPAMDIQMTRGLLLGATVQAMICMDKRLQNGKGVMLEPIIQRFVVSKWLETRRVSHRFGEEVMEGFGRYDWIRAHSEGLESECPELKEIFDTSEPVTQTPFS